MVNLKENVRHIELNKIRLEYDFRVLCKIAIIGFSQYLFRSEFSKDDDIKVFSFYWDNEVLLHIKLLSTLLFQLPRERHHLRMRVSFIITKDVQGVSKKLFDV